MAKILLVDLETRSRYDLKVAGARRYAADPSTQITVAGWMEKGANEVKSSCFIPKLRHIAKRDPDELYYDLRHADRVIAHNIGFDANVLLEQNPFLELPPEKLD